MEDSLEVKIAKAQAFLKKVMLDRGDVTDTRTATTRESLAQSNPLKTDQYFYFLDSLRCIITNLRKQRSAVTVPLAGRIMVRQVEKRLDNLYLAKWGVKAQVYAKGGTLQIRLSDRRHRGKREYVFFAPDRWGPVVLEGKLLVLSSYLLEETKFGSIFTLDVIDLGQLKSRKVTAVHSENGRLVPILGGLPNGRKLVRERFLKTFIEASQM
jgi:hypothetical protein